MVLGSKFEEGTNQYKATSIGAIEHHDIIDIGAIGYHDIIDIMMSWISWISWVS